MSQTELYEYFKMLYNKDPNKWYTAREIYQMMNRKEACGTIDNLNKQLLKLYLFGYLDAIIRHNGYRGRTGRAYRYKTSSTGMTRIISPLSPVISYREYRRLVK